MHGFVKAIRPMVLVVALMLAAPASGQLVGAPTRVSADDVNAAFGLADSRVTLLHVDTAAAAQDVVLALDFGSGAQLLRLSPHSVRTRSFQVLAQQEDGRLVPTDPGPVRTLRGDIATVPGSRVAASLLDEGLFARLDIPGEGEHWIQPIAGYVPGASPEQHVIYRTADVLEVDRPCGVELLADARPAPMFDQGTPSGTIAGSALSIAELGCDADFEYFSDYGTVGATQNRIESVINTMNLQYESEVAITHSITTIIVRTSSNQPYTSTDAFTLLSQFRSEWNANQGGVSRDVAQLFTGKEINGGTIGIAWLGVICHSSYGYGLVQSDFNNNFSCATDLSAHELGHNWDADHCSCTSFTMNPYITCANTFSPSLTIPEIEAFRDAIGCLDGGGDPPGGGDPVSVHVASIEPSTVNLGQGFKRARATVTIVDDLGDPVAGATVSGTFTGDLNESQSGVTDGNGGAVLTTVSSKKGKLKFTFCVDAVSASLPYEPADNVETCDNN